MRNKQLVAIIGWTRSLIMDRRGVSGLVFGAASLALLGAAGFAIEVGSWYQDYVRLQGLADMAAEAGAVALSRSGGSSQYQNAANFVLQQNGFDTANATIVSPPAAGPYAGNALAVQATLMQTETPLIARLFSSAAVTLSTQAVATYNTGPTGTDGADGAGPCIMAFGVVPGAITEKAFGVLPMTSIPDPNYVTPAEVEAAQAAGWNPNRTQPQTSWNISADWDSGQMILGSNAHINANGCSIVSNSPDPVNSIQLLTNDIINAYTITSSGGINQFGTPAGIDTLQRPASQYHVPTADPLAYVQQVILPPQSAFTCANPQEVYAGNLLDTRTARNSRLYPPVVVDGSVQSTTNPHKPSQWKDGWPAGWSVIPTEPPSGLISFTDHWSATKYTDPNWGTTPFVTPATSLVSYATRPAIQSNPLTTNLTSNYTPLTITVPFSCFQLSPATDPGWSFTTNSLPGMGNPNATYILTSPVIVFGTAGGPALGNQAWWTEGGNFIFDPRDADGNSVDVTVYINGYPLWSGANSIDLAPGTYFIQGEMWLGGGKVTCSKCFEADGVTPTGRGVTLVFMDWSLALLSAWDGNLSLIAPQHNNYDSRLDGILIYYASPDVNVNGTPTGAYGSGLLLGWGGTAQDGQGTSLTGAIYAPWAQIWFTNPALTSQGSPNTTTGCALFIGNTIVMDPDFSVYADLSRCNSTYGYPFGPGSNTLRTSLGLPADPVPSGAVSLVQ